MFGYEPGVSTTATAVWLTLQSTYEICPVMLDARSLSKEAATLPTLSILTLRLSGDAAAELPSSLSMSLMPVAASRP